MYVGKSLLLSEEYPYQRAISSWAALEHFIHPAPALALSQELLRKAPEWTASKMNCSEGQMPFWEKGQCTRKTNVRYALEVTLPSNELYCAASEFIRTKSPASPKGKKPPEQQHLIITDTLHLRECQSRFQTILSFWTLTAPWCLADEAAVSFMAGLYTVKLSQYQIFP